MKKLSILLVVILCLTLCGCPAAQESPAAARDVHITAGKIEPGMTVKDVLVEVVLDGQPVPCRVELTALTSDGYYVMAEDEPVAEENLIRLDVYYSLPAGCDVDNINVTMDCDGGEYDGTGSVGNDDKGNVEAWSHAIYGDIPEETTVHPVHIKVVEFAPGMAVDQIKVEVTVDGKTVEARVGMTQHSEDGMRELDPTEKIPDKALVRLNVYYYLDHGVTLDDIEVTMDFPGGEYDGTGSMAEHADGRVEAWSHAFYGENPAEPQPTEPKPTEPKPTEPKPTEPKPTEPKPTEPVHTHSWEKQSSGGSAVSCTTDTVITYGCTCGKTKTETIPAPGHDMREGSITQPTCTEKGSQTQTCKRCGFGLTVEIPATGHKWSGWTYDTGRVHARTCSSCGAKETESHKIPSGDVICTGCGAAIIN